MRTRGRTGQIQGPLLMEQDVSAELETSCFSRRPEGAEAWPPEAPAVVPY